MKVAQNVDLMAPEAWNVDREAGERHFRLYAAANLIDVDRWHEERPHVAAPTSSVPPKGTSGR